MPARRRPDRALLALGALVALSTGLRFALSRGVDAPWIAPDEQLYGLLGRSLVSGDGLTLLGQPVAYYSLLYPLLVGLPFVWANLEDGVRAVQFMQALLMSLTAVPVFLWARPLAGRRWALGAAALTVLIPGLAYSGLLMSEALYYLVATVAVWALAVCLATPTRGHQLWLLAAVGVAFATRLQAVGLAGTIVVALGLLAVAERSLAPFRRLALTLAILGVGGAVWVAVRVHAGGIGQLLGAYAPLTEAGKYSVRDIAQSLVWETGAVALVTVAVPLVALGILAWETMSRSGAGAGGARTRRLGPLVRPCDADPRRGVRVALRRARHRASAPLGRPTRLRRLRRLAPPRRPASAAGDVRRRVHRRRRGPPAPARPCHDTGGVRGLALRDPTRAPQPPPAQVVARRSSMRAFSRSCSSRPCCSHGARCRQSHSSSHSRSAPVP